MTNGAHKGSSFERLICRQLSRWWTEGERDDIFWRTAGSGGMATNRWSHGKATANQCGDIQAVDACGQPFVSACILELKNGYGKWSFLDQIDRGHNMRESSTIDQFITQAEKSCEQAGAIWPLIIAKRDQRVPVIIYPDALNKLLREFFGDYAARCNVLEGFCGGRVRSWSGTYYCVRLSNWLEWVHPDFFKERMWENRKKDGTRGQYADPTPSTGEIVEGAAMAVSGQRRRRK